jgi:hypothetical protein
MGAIGHCDHWLVLHGADLQRTGADSAAAEAGAGPTTIHKPHVKAAKGATLQRLRDAWDGVATVRKPATEPAHADAHAHAAPVLQPRHAAATPRAAGPARMARPVTSASAKSKSKKKAGF